MSELTFSNTKGGATKKIFSHLLAEGKILHGIGDQFCLKFLRLSYALQLLFVALICLLNIDEMTRSLIFNTLKRF